MKRHTDDHERSVNNDPDSCCYNKNRKFEIEDNRFQIEELGTARFGVANTLMCNLQSKILNQTKTLLRPESFKDEEYFVMAQIAGISILNMILKYIIKISIINNEH